MAVTFDKVQEVLEYCIGQGANWNRIKRRHRNRGVGPSDPHLFGWETEEQLLNAKARGHWLINPELRGNGKGDQTNLVRILTQPQGFLGYPRMPYIGNKIDLDSDRCRVLIEWIDSLPSQEGNFMTDNTAAQMSSDAKFLALGDELPPVPTVPSGFNFVQAKRVGPILYLSGMGPQWGDHFKEEFIGKVWQDLSIEQGYAAARLTGLNLLHVVRDVMGSLDEVREVVEVFGMVNGAPRFERFPQVINGCSDLLVEIFGEPGKHVRTAVGSGLPFGIAVDINMSVRVADVD